MRRRCDWCGKQADAIGDDGARELGWLVGFTAMCRECAGPEVCVECREEECVCDSTHVMPRNDLTEHIFVNCVCGPDERPVKREDGSIGWLIIHHSLDGREKCE